MARAKMTIDLDMSDTAAKLRAAANELDPPPTRSYWEQRMVEMAAHRGVIAACHEAAAEAHEYEKQLRAREAQDDTSPRLGFATTRQLLEEVKARVECDTGHEPVRDRLREQCASALDLASARWLDYTTARWATDGTCAHDLPDGEDDCAENCTRHRTCRAGSQPDRH